MDSSNEEQAQKVKNTLLVQNERSKNNFKNGYLLLIVTFIIALGALAAATYALLLNTQLQDKLISERTNFSMQLNELGQKEDKVQEQIYAKTNNAQETQVKLQSQFDDLSKEVQRAMNQKFYQNQDWLLLKVRYYLELAQINAHWSNNLESTVALLQQADQFLKQFNDPRIYPIRQSIAKDIAQIQAMPTLDITGILSQLDAAQNIIDDLNIPLPLSNDKPSPENSKTTENSSWRTQLQSNVHLFEKLVVIRHHDKNIKPILSPLLETILKENLHLNLQEAQSAVLNREPFVYQLVLKQAIRCLKMNFNENLQNTSALIKKLTNLQQINVAPKKPTIGSALPMLNELIDGNIISVNQPMDSKKGGKK